jgi:hypothetical protein
MIDEIGSRDWIINNHEIVGDYVVCIGHCCDWHYRQAKDFEQFSKEVEK